jgi:DNA-binding response OmpR family regulator
MKKVLIIEDEEQIRSFLRTYLKASDFEVWEAQDGEDALKLLSEKIPDIIVTDIMMPKMDGVQFYLTLKEDVELQNIPVIVLTSRNAREDFEYASLLGMDEYLRKPFDPEEVVKIIREKLE